MLSADVSPWLGSDAACSPDRPFCHAHGRSKAAAQIILGWPYPFVAALTPGRTSWTAVLDAVRPGPADDAITVTAIQLRTVVECLVATGQWQPEGRDVQVVMDTGYDSLDNALAENLWMLIKTECVRGRVLTTRAEANLAFFESRIMGEAARVSTWDRSTAGEIGFALVEQLDGLTDIPEACGRTIRWRLSDNVAVEEFRNWNSDAPRRWRAFIWSRRDAGRRRVEEAAVRAAAMQQTTTVALSAAAGRLTP